MLLISGLKRAIELYYDHLATINCNTCNPARWAINTGWYAHEPRVAPVQRHLTLLKTDNQEPIHSTVPSPANQATRILVISRKARFSRDMINYSLDMASKRNAEIMALNLDECERDFNAFQDKARSNAVMFMEKANKAGIRFSHMVCDGPERTAIEHVSRVVGEPDFVMDDVPALCGADHAIPVYIQCK
ncbi:hypothetical protein [Desulfoplanes formicivorans]|uniref:UspA domain-containing protein n=1 Tax=Desulfoplanes formicivorans TaxID=1592317 RepID=A0A194ALJ3_9BACT|nr:hypothetical protein [Desulfoplanes formicivorans]GAU09896.1 hypothetical protein DPF_2632 [Desulfoplanes formicivorans]